MEFHIAPMEGITYPEYRIVHARMFPGAQKYYAPFIAPGGGKINKNYIAKRLPDIEAGVSTVPQLMANSSERFISCAVIIRDMGYSEINLNAGCPSATVFSKHKGAGMLVDLNSLDDFLCGVFSASELSGMKISVKTRMGINSVEEFGKILEIYNRYPISCLTVHARDRAGMYKSKPALNEFIGFYPQSSNPVSYNGNIFSTADLTNIMQELPTIQTVMVGRGVMANPALIRMLNGGEKLDLEELLAFYGELTDAYLSSGLDSYIVVQRMKELWFYMSSLFGSCDREKKQLFKSKNYEEYLSAVRSIITNCSFDGSAHFINPGQNQ